MSKCAHTKRVDDEQLADTDDVDDETSPWDLDNKELIAVLEEEAYDVYELGTCPCRLNECRKALLHRLGDTQ